jgi:hypothetical protein
MASNRSRPPAPDFHIKPLGGTRGDRLQRGKSTRQIVDHRLGSRQTRPVQQQPAPPQAGPRLLPRRLASASHPHATSSSRCPRCEKSDKSARRHGHPKKLNSPRSREKATKPGPPSPLAWLHACATRAPRIGEAIPPQLVSRPSPAHSTGRNTRVTRNAHARGEGACRAHCRRDHGACWLGGRSPLLAPQPSSSRPSRH